MKLNKVVGHLKTINHHKWLVFKLSVKAGIPLQGLVHDLSKYSLGEFFESVKYYTDGSGSPLGTEKKKIGFSPAWLHHKGRNKHHHEYWYDYDSPLKSAPMPFKYFVEMVCDQIAANMNYKKEKFTLFSPLEYYNRKTSKLPIHEGILKSLKEVYEMLPKEGINKTLKKDNLRKIYDRNVGDKNEFRKDKTIS